MITVQEAIRAERPLSSSPRVQQFSSLPFRTIMVLAVHVPLGLAMHQYPIIATAHAALTLAVALLIALGPRVERMAYAAAYFCGSEVLWKMCHAQSPWEFGKYGVILIFTIGIIRRRPFQLHWPSAVFAVLLLPSAALTLIGLDLKTAQGQISFNLAGPIALAISVCFFVTIDLPPRAQRRTVIALVAPLISIVTVTAFATYFVGGVEWGTESNFASSGGFGPNQVSAILGFGALTTFLASFDRWAGVGFRTIMLWLTAIFTVQSAMTFSRGGLLAASVSAAASLFYLMRDRSSRLRLVVILILLSVAGVYVVAPQLERITGGALGKRFNDRSLTKRDNVVRDDIDIWIANPVLGTGPGMAKVKRMRSNGGYAPMASHTEYTRLLAEHGLLGLAALGMLLLICVHGWQRATTQRSKATVTALLVWGTLFMLQSGTRIVAPSLAFGLAYGMGRSPNPWRRNAAPLPAWMSSANLLLQRAKAHAQRRVFGAHRVPVTRERS